MLHKFFVTKANQPCIGDWTETVKNDLEQFDIQYDFNYFKSKSKDAFKKILKVKANDVALDELKIKQQQQKHPKQLKLLVHAIIVHVSTCDKS